MAIGTAVSSELSAWVLEAVTPALGFRIVAVAILHLVTVVVTPFGNSKLGLE
jgi:hypothetical protein